MADANTTTYSFVKPEVGASADTWGTKLNSDMDDVDALLTVLTTAGGTTAYTLTSGLSLAAYVSGQSFLIKMNATNTGASTLNVDSLGAKSITKSGTLPLTAGDLVIGHVYRVSYDGTRFQVHEAVGSQFSGFIYGLTLSNNGSDATNDIDIAAGVCADGSNAKIMALTSSLTKRLDASWAVGTNQGGLDTGSIANTTYHVWLIMRSDTGVVDALFSESAASPTMPANYDYKRRIGSVLRESSALVTFVQSGDEFMRKSPVQDLGGNSLGTSAASRTLSVPSGIKVDALLNVSVGSTAGTAAERVYLSDLDQTDSAPGATTAPQSSIGIVAASAGTASVAVQVRVRTNTSRQIRSRSLVGGATETLYIATRGWIDTRGRFG